MKKIIIFLSCVFLLSGCGKTNDDGLIKNLDKKVKNSKNYQIVATLSIFRNEEKFEYDVVSTYKTGEFFKVELTNKTNNHKQIILKDMDSVYVLTPSLNKSFKFKSDWPYNNSQIYLLQPIILDVMNDENRTFEKSEQGHIVISNVNYSGEREFKKQKIYFDLEKNIRKVEIIDENKEVKMCLQIINLDYDVKLPEGIFDINKYQINDANKEDTEAKKQEQNFNVADQNSNKDLPEIVYPMYVPSDTYLSGQNVVSTKNGERVILTFTGDSQFTLVQENLNKDENLGFVYGDPYLILDTVGAVTDSSVTWISGDVEYSVISDTMSVDELILVAQSISVEPVGK